MPLTGNWTLAILSALALLAAVTAVLFWDRIRSCCGGRRGWR